MRILSLNAWGGRIHNPLLKYLGSTKADILCLQEVVRTSGQPHGWLTYRDGDLRLPQRSNLFDEIRALLPAHRAQFVPVARGLLHDDYGREIWSEFGLATFVRESYATIGEALGFVHGAFTPDSWGEHPRARNAHCVRVFDPDSGLYATIAQMHGLRDPAGKGDTPARAEQSMRLVKLIESVWPGDERLVVCGDFNLLPQSSTFARLATLGLSDLVTGRGYTDTRTSFYEKEGRFADYMLVNDRVDVVGFEVVADPEVSDHRPLLLKLR
ncbi:endonuclease/exonuclease/phosphatase family protein [Sinorhizobium medicae]|nr:endonuclease/exonuclease/phosphatase family protein [Sinorhizobium medicae]MDX1020630.1 endonuclease/exonuclease/phosphatase family protein [Sinorhizobium medicae]